MEFRDLLKLIRSRWWIPTGLAALVLLFSLAQMVLGGGRGYTVEIRMLIGVHPIDVADESLYDPRYYAWLVSEYLVDDFSEVVASGLFAENVTARLLDDYDIEIKPEAIQGNADTGRTHRILDMEFEWPNEQEAIAIGDAVTAEITENSEAYFRQLTTVRSEITVIEGPVVEPTAPTLLQRLELPLRLILSLFAGLSIILLLDYLDSSIRERKELEALGFPVLAEIPK